MKTYMISAVFFVENVTLGCVWGQECEGLLLKYLRNNQKGKDV